MRHSYRPSATERFKIVSSKSGRFAAIEGTTEQLAGGCTLYRIKRPIGQSQRPKRALWRNAAPCP